MRRIYLTGLDDSLFSTLTHHGVSASQARGWLCVTTANSEQPSFMSPAQQCLFELLHKTGIVIPVTSRSSEAFSRVQLDFGSRRAILANGAVILDEHGVADPDWRLSVELVTFMARHEMQTMLDVCRARLGDRARCWLVQEAGLSVYFCLNANATEPSLVDAVLREACEVIRQAVSLSNYIEDLNGNRLCYVPRYSSKGEACRHLIENMRSQDPDLMFIGVGNSLTDLPFMSLCDFVLAPSGSQLVQRALGLETA